MAKKSALQKRKDNCRSSYWDKKAMQAWGEYIRKRDVTCAVNDGCKGNLEAHHLLTRSIRAFRHEPMNGILLCSKHHKFCPHLSAHKAPLAFADWLEAHRFDQAQWARDHKWHHANPLDIDYRAAYFRLTELLESC